MKRTLWKSRWTRPGAAIACIAALAFVAMPAGADHVSIWDSPFTNLSNNTSLDGSQYHVNVYFIANDDVHDPFAGTNNIALFTFSNLGPNSGVIANIYWDETDPDVLAFETFFSMPANWSVDANPSDFQGGALDPTFAVQESSDADNPKPANGIDVGESASFYVALGTGYGQADLLDRLVSGDLRMGLHVISLGEESDWFYAPPDDPGQPVVPVPPAAGIGLLGMAILGVVRARKRRAA